MRQRDWTQLFEYHLVVCELHLDSAKSPVPKTFSREESIFPSLLVYKNIFWST